MFMRLLAILKVFLSVYLRVRRCVEKLTFRKVTLTFDLDLWRQCTIDAKLFFKDMWYLKFFNIFIIYKVIDICLKRLFPKNSKLWKRAISTLFVIAIWNLVCECFILKVMCLPNFIKIKIPLPEGVCPLWHVVGICPKFKPPLKANETFKYFPLKWEFFPLESVFPSTWKRSR